MPEPALSVSQTSGLQDALALANAGSSGAATQIPKIQASIQSQVDLDSGMKSLFDYNNDTVIGNYEKERRYADGQTVQQPLTDADIEAFANLVPGNRLIDGTSLPPKRISQFDGSPLGYADPNNFTDLNEKAQYAWQDLYSNLLSLGFSSGLAFTGALTVDPINSSNKSVKAFITGLVPIAFAAGQMIGIGSGADAAVMKLTSASSVSGAGGFTYTLGYDYILPPLGVLAGGSSVQPGVPAFSNGERTTLVATNGALQPFLTTYANGMRTALTNRQSALTKELAAFNANGNEKKNPIAGTNISASLSFVQNFLSNFDLTDTGLGKLSRERVYRLTQITQRIIDIHNEILNGPKGSFYDRRYDTAAARCTLGNGSLYVLNALNNQLVKLQAGASSAQALSQRWSSFLPS